MRSLIVLAIPPALAIVALYVLSRRRQSPAPRPSKPLWLLSEFGHATKAAREHIAPFGCARRWRRSYVALETEETPRVSEDRLRSTLHRTMAALLRYEVARSSEER